MLFKFIFIFAGSKSKPNLKSSGGIEREYIRRFFTFLTDNEIVKKELIAKPDIDSKGFDNPSKALKHIKEKLKKNKTEYYKDFQKKQLNEYIIPCVIMDFDERHQEFKTPNLQKDYKEAGINLFISNRSFEQWVELHISNDNIPLKKALSTEKKLAYLQCVKKADFIGKTSLKKAYDYAKSRYESAQDNSDNPFYIDYAGSDMFAFIDLIHTKLLKNEKTIF